MTIILTESVVVQLSIVVALSLLLLVLLATNRADDVVGNHDNQDKSLLIRIVSLFLTSIK